MQYMTIIRKWEEFIFRSAASYPMGRPPRSSVRSQHRLAHVDNSMYCVMCMSQKMYKLTDKQCVARKVYLCFTSNRDCLQSGIFHVIMESVTNT